MKESWDNKSEVTTLKADTSTGVNINNDNGVAIISRGVSVGTSKGINGIIIKGFKEKKTLAEHATALNFTLPTDGTLVKITLLSGGAGGGATVLIPGNTSNSDSYYYSGGGGGSGGMCMWFTPIYSSDMLSIGKGSAGSTTTTTVSEYSTSPLAIYPFDLSITGGSAPIDDVAAGVGGTPTPSLTFPNNYLKCIGSYGEPGVGILLPDPDNTNLAYNSLTSGAGGGSLAGGPGGINSGPQGGLGGNASPNSAAGGGGAALLNLTKDAVRFTGGAGADGFCIIEWRE